MGQSRAGAALGVEETGAMNHKRGRARNRRAGCKLCKPWKVNGVGKSGNRGSLPEKYSDHNRRDVADRDIREQQ